MCVYVYTLIIIFQRAQRIVEAVAAIVVKKKKIVVYFRDWISTAVCYVYMGNIYLYIRGI